MGDCFNFLSSSVSSLFKPALNWDGYATAVCVLWNVDNF